MPSRIDRQTDGVPACGSQGASKGSFPHFPLASNHWFFYPEYLAILPFLPLATKSRPGPSPSRAPPLPPPRPRHQAVGGLSRPSGTRGCWNRVCK